MLFDLSSGRRKSVVRVVYAILALLMGSSLFLAVGPVNLTELIGSSSSTSSATEALREQSERIEHRLRKDPNNEALQAALIRARIATSKTQFEVNSETGTGMLTPEGIEEVNQATETWNRYLKQTKSPNPALASLVAGAYFYLAQSSVDLQSIVGNIDNAAEAQRIAAKARPNLGSLSTLAIYEYYAGNFAAADQATKESVAKAGTKSEAKEIKEQLGKFRKEGKEFKKQKKQFAKVEAEKGKEALKNPLGELSGSGTAPFTP